MRILYSLLQVVRASYRSEENELLQLEMVAVPLPRHHARRDHSRRASLFHLDLPQLDDCLSLRRLYCGQVEPLSHTADKVLFLK
jgi:hypothetical protein